MKKSQVYVVQQKVFLNLHGYDVMSATQSSIAGVFEDRASAIDFVQHLIDGISNVEGQRRTFHMSEAKVDNKPTFEFIVRQRENALYPRFVYECTCETVLSKEN
jgi:hypothetical protein